MEEALKTSFGRIWSGNLAVPFLLSFLLINKDKLAVANVFNETNNIKRCILRASNYLAEFILKGGKGDWQKYLPRGPKQKFSDCPHAVIFIPKRSF